MCLEYGKCSLILPVTIVIIQEMVPSMNENIEKSQRLSPTKEGIAMSLRDASRGCLLIQKTQHFVQIYPILYPS